MLCLQTKQVLATRSEKNLFNCEQILSLSLAGFFCYIVCLSWHFELYSSLDKLKLILKLVRTDLNKIRILLAGKYFLVVPVAACVNQSI